MRGVTALVKLHWLRNSISTHTPHARRDGLVCIYNADFFKFQLTRLMRGVTFFLLLYSADFRKFQLTRLMRGVTVACRPLRFARIFQLTRLMRGVTFVDARDLSTNNDFNSHASCEA